MAVRETWKSLAKETRLLIAEWLMYKAIVIAPRGSRLQLDLAKFFIEYIPKAKADSLNLRERKP